MPELDDLLNFYTYVSFIQNFIENLALERTEFSTQERNL